MAPKKKGGKVGKKKKSNKPAWMSDAMYDLSMNLQKLNEFWTGELKDNKLKEGQEPPPNISKEQAGLFIWQLLYPNSKPGKEKREESVKLGLVESSVKMLSKGEAPEATCAIGILQAMTRDNEIQRGIMLDAKPAPLPALLRWLGHDSASLRAGVCGLLRVCSVSEDSRPRLWRAMKQDWDWSPLVACLNLTGLSQLGGRAAAHDAAALIEALCCAPEQDVATAACTAAVNYGVVPAIVQLLHTRNAHPMAKACSVAVLHAIMRRASAEQCEGICLAQGALEPLVAVFGNPVIPLPYQAHTAACLLRFIMPDSLWRDSSALAAHNAKTAASGGTAMADVTTEAEGGEGGSRPGSAEDARPGTASDNMTSAVGHTLEQSGPGVADIELLDEATREVVLARARKVAGQPGAITALTKLCVGPDGPLPDLELPPPDSAPPPVDEGNGKKGKKKKGKKKKGKLEPGMAEAQTYGSAVLRLASLSEEMRVEVAAAGAIRYLLPLLDTKTSAARWNARQALVNLSMSLALVDKLKLYKVPEYVHGGNIPASHYQRPYPDEQPAAPALKKADSLKRGGAKPPALKGGQQA